MEVKPPIAALGPSVFERDSSCLEGDHHGVVDEAVDELGPAKSKAADELGPAKSKAADELGPAKSKAADELGPAKSKAVGGSGRNCSRSLREPIGDREPAGRVDPPVQI
jgi:hypothetical protein